MAYIIVIAGLVPAIQNGKRPTVGSGSPGQARWWHVVRGVFKHL